MPSKRPKAHLIYTICARQKDTVVDNSFFDRLAEKMLHLVFQIDGLEKMLFWAHSGVEISPYKSPRNDGLPWLGRCEVLAFGMPVSFPADFLSKFGADD